MYRKSKDDRVFVFFDALRTYSGCVQYLPVTL